MRVARGFRKAGEGHESLKWVQREFREGPERVSRGSRESLESLHRESREGPESL